MGNKTGITYRNLKYYFKPKELQELSNSLVEDSILSRQKEEEKSSVVSQYTSEIKEIKLRINGTANKIKTGFEWRDTKCTIQYDYPQRLKTIIRDDTGEIVDELPIPEDECQQALPLPLDESKDKKALGICRAATKCRKAEECAHGRPHEYFEECKGGDCFDIIPSEKVWCDAIEQTQPSDEQNAPGNEQMLEIDDDFIKKMNNAKSAAEATTIVEDYEMTLHQIQELAHLNPIIIRPQLDQKLIAKTVKAVSKADPKLGARISALFDQWPSISRISAELHAEEITPDKLINGKWEDPAPEQKADPEPDITDEPGF